MRRIPALLAAAASLSIAGSAIAAEGMWTFDNFPIAAANRALGTNIDQDWLDRVRLASVRIGTASGGLVSPDGLIFTNERGDPVRRNRFGEIWRAAVSQAGLDGLRFHDLRHFYASLLIRHGESVKVVQARLGHASASETLDTYSHLWPDNEERTRAAVDTILGAAHDARRSS